jgi:hypothetical protein
MSHPGIVSEVASVFWNAIKETPRQMVAPYVAAWRELVKNATPARPRDDERPQAQRSGPG